MPINYEAAKTLIRGLVQKMKSFRGNWNQNDPTADDYIKNRPFYSECLKRTIIPETTATIIGNVTIECYPIISFDIGQTYNVVWNGIKYSCVATLLNGIAALGDFEFTKLPFVIAIDERLFGGAYVAAIEEGEYTFSVTGIIEQVHKIDSKYIDIPANLATTDDVESKMDAVNPVGTGSFSMNRKAGTTIGLYSHAEGSDTTASGNWSHAEGIATIASGNYSHAEGFYTIASRSYQHAQGKYNIEDTENKYAHIVGNGPSYNARSNAHTLDWSGNAWYQGSIKVGGTGWDDATDEVAYKSDITDSATDTVVTASASAWGNNIITLSVTGVTATSKLEIGLSETATDEQFTAAVAAQIRATGSDNGTVTLKAMAVPSVDLPILIRRFS